MDPIDIQIHVGTCLLYTSDVYKRQMQYRAPKTGQYDPLTVSVATLSEILSGSSRPLSSCLVEALQGISFQTACEILSRAFGEDVPESATPAQAEHLARVAKDFVQSALSSPCPCIPVSYTHLDVYKRQILYLERLNFL